MGNPNPTPLRKIVPLMPYKNVLKEQVYNSDGSLNAMYTNGQLNNTPLPVLNPPIATSIQGYQYNPQANHIPLQNDLNSGITKDYSLYSHNPPYSPYGNQTKAQAANQALSNLGIPFLKGGGDVYRNFPEQNLQQQADVSAIQNSLLNAQQTDAQGNPITVNPNTETQQIQPAEQTQNPADKTYYDPNPITRNSNTTARNAMAFNAITDAAALANNIIQPPPPTINLPLTHLSRIKYDRSQFDTANQEVKEQAATSARRMREGMSQAADLASSEGIINKNTAEAQRQIGMQERELANQEMLQNNQLANQEQAGIDQTLTQQQLTNFQNQAAAATDKGNAITKNLESLKQDFSTAAQYNIAQQTNLQQQELDKENIQKQQEIDLLGIEYQIMNDYQSSPNYQQGVANNRAEQMASTHKQIADRLKSEGLADLSGMTWQDVYNQEKITQQATAISQQIQSLESSKMALQELNAAQADPQFQQKMAVIEEEQKAAEMEANKIKNQLSAIQRYKQLLPEYYQQQNIDNTYDENYRKINEIKNAPEYLKRFRQIANRQK